jgi:hypothetical protein
MLHPEMHKTSVAELHHLYAAPAPTLMYSKATFFKRTKDYTSVSDPHTLYADPDPAF